VSFAVRGFLRSAVVWLLLGLALGLAMALDPGRTPLYRAAHLHALLPGFVLFMIFGVGYHVLPRFSGRSLRWPRLPGVHLALANGGVLLLVAGLLARVHAPPPFPGAAWTAFVRLALPVGGLLYLAGALLFALVTWTLTEAPSWHATKLPHPPGAQPRAPTPFTPISR
jgi:cbb3-type cytochrome oxidase subunit 1